MRVHSLKSLIHNKESMTTPFQTFGRWIIDGDTHWGASLRLSGKFGYIKNYWKWLEDILRRSKQVFRENHLFDALYVSLFTYDGNPHVLRAFCEVWCLDTNILHISVGEFSFPLGSMQIRRTSNYQRHLWRGDSMSRRANWSYRKEIKAYSTKL